MVSEPKSLSDRVAKVRSGLVCGRCGKYVGSLAPNRYLPPPYSVALGQLTADDEAEVIIGFEAHMIGRIRRGNFRIMHPQVKGRCASYREWVLSDDDPADNGEAAEGE